MTLIGFIFITIAVPFGIAFVLRRKQQSALACFLVPYAISVAIYFIIVAIIGEFPKGEIYLIPMLLMAPSFIGSMLAQVAYIIEIRKREKETEKP